jgi:hypothetical protein
MDEIENWALSAGPDDNSGRLVSTTGGEANEFWLDPPQTERFCAP